MNSKIILKILILTLPFIGGCEAELKSGNRTVGSGQEDPISATDDKKITKVEIEKDSFKVPVTVEISDPKFEEEIEDKTVIQPVSITIKDPLGDVVSEDDVLKEFEVTIVIETPADTSLLEV